MLEKLSGTRGEIYEQYLVRAIFAPWASDLVDSAEVRSAQRIELANADASHQAGG